MSKKKTQKKIEIGLIERISLCILFILLFPTTYVKSVALNPSLIFFTIKKKMQFFYELFSKIVWYTNHAYFSQLIDI